MAQDQGLTGEPPPAPQDESNANPGVIAVRHRTEMLPVALNGPVTANVPSVPPPASNATAEHARQESDHKATLKFFTGHRERQGTLSVSRRGSFAIGELLPLQYQTLFRQPATGEKPSPAVVPPANSKQTMVLAQAAFMRTMNFLDDLVARTPVEERGGLQEEIAHAPGPPRNLPKDEVVLKFQMFARQLGYYGPVLWYMPSHISLTHLKNAGLVNPTWWWNEPNFPKGYQTLSPYEPEDHGESHEPGFWVLALPGIMPGTANRSFEEQADLKRQIACSAGINVRDGHIDHRECIRAMIGNVADMAVFFAMAKQARELLSGEPVVVRTSSVVRTYQPDENGGSGLADGSKFSPSLQSVCHVSVAVFPDAPLQLCDYGDTARGVALGLAPFFIPFAY